VVATATGTSHQLRSAIIVSVGSAQPGHNRARNRRPIGFALQGPAGSPCAERFGEPSSEPHGARLLGLRGLDLTPGDRALDLKGPTPRL